MKRRNLLIAFGAGLAVPLASFAQQQGKIRRIGFLAARSRSTSSNPDAEYDAFVQAMRELGYVEGRNLFIEWRYAEGNVDRLPGFAAELVRLNPEVILTHGTPGSVAAQRATSTIPIVFAAAGDPVKSGLAASLARPGGNITGLSLLTADIFPKQLELLRAMLPKVTRVAVLVHPGNPTRQTNLKNIQSAAQNFGISIIAVDVGVPEDFVGGFASMARAGAEALIIFADSFFIVHRRRIVELTAKHRLPSMYYFREDTQVGGLMSYGQNTVDYYRRAALYVDKILKGAKAGELPIEQPTKIHLAINRGTAKALGLVVPQSLLLRADEVIE